MNHWPSLLQENEAITANQAVKCRATLRSSKRQTQINLLALHRRHDKVELAVRDVAKYHENGRRADEL